MKSVLARAANILGLTICISGAADPGLAGDIFRCVMKETRHISDDGRQITYPNDIYAGDLILADTSSGLVRMFGAEYRFEVVQQGSTSNAWVLSKIEPGFASTAVLMLAIKVYQPGIPFLFTNGMSVHTGQCQAVR